jgi:hypothetical protein
MQSGQIGDTVDMLLTETAANDWRECMTTSTNDSDFRKMGGTGATDVHGPVKSSIDMTSPQYNPWACLVYPRQRLSFSAYYRVDQEHGRTHTDNKDKVEPLGQTCTDRVHTLPLPDF